jgi:hypothetical protein
MADFSDDHETVPMMKPFQAPVAKVQALPDPKNRILLMFGVVFFLVAATLVVVAHAVIHP